MARIHNQITINAPIQKVWGILADLEQVQYYNPAVTKTRFVSPNHEGVGAARHCDFKDGRWVKERVIASVPQKSLSIEMYEHQWPVKFMRWRTDMKPEGSGTLVSQDLEYEVKFGLLGKLMDLFVMRRMMNKALKEIFERMKAYMETGVRTNILESDALKRKELIGTWRTTVNVPVQKIWDILSDSSHMAVWGRTMVKHTDAGKEHLGAVRHCELDFGGRRGSVREVTVVHEPNQQIFWSMEEDTLGMKKMMKEFIFGFKTVPLGPSSTDVQFEQYFVPQNFLKKLIIKFLMKPKMAATNKLLLRDLKAMVEGKK